jgi:polyferredoxin
MVTEGISSDTERSLPGELASPVATKTKKKFVRRTEPDRSQITRHAVQIAFALLNIFLCVQFYFWARYYETGGASVRVSRPAGVDGWLPIAGLMNLKFAVSTATIPKIHPAAFFLLTTFIVVSLIFKKAFCSWLCPIGLLSEYLWKVGKKLLGRNLELPRWLDIALRGVKYLLLSFFLFIVGGMSAAALADFMAQPYGIIADVKMLNFFRHMSSTSLAIVGVLVLGSVLIKNFWCRYACPYGALMGFVSLLSPVKIRRDAEACIDCGKCSKACPEHLPVDKLVQVRSGECTACMECVASCDTLNALQFAVPPRVAETREVRWAGRALRPITVAAAITALFLGVVSYAKLTHHWQTVVPDSVYMELVQHAEEESHPGF